MSNKVVTDITKYVNKIRDIAEEEIHKSSYAVHGQAVASAPVNESILKSSAYIDVKDLTGEVGFTSRYAAFLEFGTGTLVDVPSELTEFAAQFKNQSFGSYTEFKESLRLWMRRKGIEDKFLFPIMMKLLRVGQKPQPFLFPAYFKERENLIKKLKQEIDAIKSSN